MEQIRPTCLDGHTMSENLGQEETGATDNNNLPESGEWTRLVAAIQTGDPRAIEQLYQVFGKGIRYYLYRQLGPQDLDDKMHDTFLIVLQAIRNGDLREPDRLMGFVRTIVRRQVAAHIDHVVHARREHTPVESGVVLVDQHTTPEEKAIGREKVEIMLKILRAMSARDREILTRFYLNEQTQEQICEEMNLTDTQFRLLKSRAKARFGELGKRKVESRSQTKSFMRAFSGTRN